MKVAQVQQVFSMTWTTYDENQGRGQIYVLPSPAIWWRVRHRCDRTTTVSIRFSVGFRDARADGEYLCTLSTYSTCTYVTAGAHEYRDRIDQRLVEARAFDFILPEDKLK